MNIEEILNAFTMPAGKFPTEALCAALEQQETITPHLLSILENVITDYESLDFDRMDYIFALYLLAKFREKRAFALILAIAALPDEWPEVLLGDCITEALPRFIVSTFDNDVLAIKRVVEHAEVNHWSRVAALRSLLGLVAIQKLPREELVEYIHSLFQSPLAEDGEFVTDLVNIASDLYPEELLNEINAAFDSEKVDRQVVDKKWIQEVLAQGKEQCLSIHVYNARFHSPIDNVEEDMGWMVAFDSEYANRNMSKPLSQDNVWDLGYHDHADSVTTYVRSAPKIGRNDPCICGSGKKYKKCCLV